MTATEPRCAPYDFASAIEIVAIGTLRRQLGADCCGRLLAALEEAIGETLQPARVRPRHHRGYDAVFTAPDAAAAASMLEALASRLRGFDLVPGLTVDLRLAIGAAQAEAGEPVGTLSDRADDALGDALQGRDKLVFAPSHAMARIETGLLGDLSHALASDGLALAYQPKLATRSNRVDAAEALLRWPHPTRGNVPIEPLIRLLEATGAIREVTTWVLERLIADQAWLRDRGHGVAIDMNLSAVLLSDRAYTGYLIERIGGAGAAIGLEITETAVINDPEAALANLAAFHEAGIRIAIDDYGSGLSSLAYLKQLPAQELKIDRQFIADIVDSHRDPLLVRSSIDLAHALEMQVTAEGVDNPIALALLRVMGCDAIQGYLVAPPLPLAKFEQFLIDHRAADAAPSHPAPELRRIRP